MELNKQIISETQALQNNLIKPQGSLGVLEKISIQIAGITGKVKNTLNNKVIFLFGSDHGIHEEGVSSSPQIVTAKLMKSYAEKQNAGINILTRQANADLKIFDLGVKYLEYDSKNIISKKFMPNGTNNFLHERAMSIETAKDVIDFGISLVKDAKSKNINIIGTGEVGMANTTSAAACIMASLNLRDENLIGRGAGLDDTHYNKKKLVILEALKLHEKDFTDSINIISCVGGLDIAAMTGVFLGGEIYGIPIVIDGVISVAGALLASKISKSSVDFMIASHKSLEPAYDFAIKSLGLEPFLNLKMRLGEGTGCAIAFQIIDDALEIINNMGTFDDF